MAPKFRNFGMTEQSFSNAHGLKTLFQFCVLILLFSETSSFKGCEKPRCYFFTYQNSSTSSSSSSSSSRPVKIKGDKALSDLYTTICFEGLKRSYLRIWSNPVLHITRPETSWNESNTFNTFYGDSLEAVEMRRQQPGYIILQTWMASLRTFKQNEDFDLLPFNLSCYVIVTDVDYTARVIIKGFDLWYLAYLAAGIILFFSAKAWSHNTSLHYGSGISFGVLASILILIFILTRLMPQKLKTLGYLFMLLGSSASLWLLSTVGNFMHEPVAEKFIEYWQYIVGYVIVSGVISFAIVYRYGPVTDQRTLNLIQWFLQIIGLVLIYHSTQLPEVSIAIILVVLVIYNFPRAIFRNKTVRYYWQRVFPPRIKMISQEEYIREGNETTKKELEKLRDFCKSPDCHAWKIISKLKTPQRFADFVEGNSWHLSSDEVLEYDSGPDPTASHLLTDDDEEEDEIDFMLNSP